MVLFIFIIVLLLALGILGAVLKGLLWLSAIAVVLMIVAFFSIRSRFRSTNRT